MQNPDVSAFPLNMAKTQLPKGGRLKLELSLRETQTGGGLLPCARSVATFRLLCRTICV